MPTPITTTAPQKESGCLTHLLSEENWMSTAPQAHRGKNNSKMKHLVEVSLPRFQKDLEQEGKQLQSAPDNAPGPPNTPQVQINAAILKGFQIYGGVHCPALAIFADPHALPADAPADSTKRATQVAEDQARTSEQAEAFQVGNPSATVIRIPNASYFVFRSNETEVLREMNAFIAKLP